MRYLFSAKDESGNVKKGTVEALDRELAAQLLQRNGLVPFSVERENAGFSFEKQIQKTFFEKE